LYLNDHYSVEPITWIGNFQDTNHNSVHYYHLELKNHSIIIANEVLSETYLDLNTRTIFETNEKINEVPLLEPVLV